MRNRPEALTRRYSSSSALIVGHAAGPGAATGCSMDALLDLVDEIELPAATLDLPDAERRQDRRRQKRQENESDEAPGAAVDRVRVFAVDSGSAGHGIWLMSCAASASCWCSDGTSPTAIRESAITTRTRVKISAIIDQPPSDLGLMCRK